MQSNLYFPSTGLLADFILNNELTNMQSFDHTLTASFTDEQIKDACDNYEALTPAMLYEFEQNRDKE